MPTRLTARRLRFHLSTAILLVLTAGLLLGLNLSERSTGPKAEHWRRVDPHGTIISRAFGWPFVYSEEVYLVDTGEQMQRGPLQGWALAADVATSALILAAVAWTAERWIEWKHRRSTAHGAANPSSPTLEARPDAFLES